MKKTLTLFAVVACLSAPLASSAQQRFQFSQYMFNGLVLSPAYCGADESLSLTFYNRSQWGKVDGAPKTQTLSAHNLFRKKVGLGLMLINDEVGVHQNYSISASTAYHLQVGASAYVSLGIQVGFAHRESDYLALGPNVIQDPKVANSTIAQNKPEMGAGIFFRSARFQMGISAPQFLPSTLQVNDTVSVSLRSTQFFLFSKYKIPLSAAISAEPGVLIKYHNGVPLSYDVYTALHIHKVLIAGVSYRKKESVALLLKAQVTPQLQLGYGYDHIIGEVAAIAQASHELMINYQFRFNRHHIASPR